ncbi:hypothetical protein BC628DRAFT_908054 [Trametes gibbosa]|nr:hypothetical protein BC628DRAFT_908054 [Trametes gibbosa]
MSDQNNSPCSKAPHRHSACRCPSQRVATSAHGGSPRRRESRLSTDCVAVRLEVVYEAYNSWNQTKLDPEIKKGTEFALGGARTHLHTSVTVNHRRVADAAGCQWRMRPRTCRIRPPSAGSSTVEVSRFTLPLTGGSRRLRFMLTTHQTLRAAWWHTVVFRPQQSRRIVGCIKRHTIK